MNREITVGEGVESPVEITLSGPKIPSPRIQMRLLGPLTVIRDGVELALPPSRKVRALLGYLAMAPRAVGRSRLCELLWDVPNDPRGELRCCLSKLRGILDDPARTRVTTGGDAVSLDLSDCLLDTAALNNAVGSQPVGSGELVAQDLREVLKLFRGTFLEGLEVERNPQFDAWLVVQRRRFRDCQIDLLDRLLSCLPAESDEALSLLDSWLEVAPFDVRAHRNLLSTLVERGQTIAGEEHLAAAAGLFDAEDLDFEPVRTAWAQIRARRVSPSPARPLPATSDPALPTPDTATGTAGTPGRRASIAVMPFLEQPVARGGLADGLTHDIIARLAKLRSLFVIARGSVFTLAEQGTLPEEAARRLNVDYVASGRVRLDQRQVVVDVELVEARSGRIVWADTFDQPLEDALILLDEIGNRIVASIANEVETAERNRALLKAPNSLDAWEAYHRGLWHMYRFTKDENAQARHFFQMAVRLDPTFSRAHAGLSFTHWQSAFQQWDDRDQQSDQAFAAAGQGLLADEHDPAAHWAMGRALWLRGRQDGSLVELERAVELSPNFALGHYALSFVQSQSGDPLAAIRASDHSRHLSPFDPLLFGMLGTRAMAHVRLGQYEEAVEWALKAAARPNAHPSIQAIAAHCLALAGRVEEGRNFAASIRRAVPGYGIENFLRTFQFTPDAVAQFRQGAKLIGLG
jgi:DNA-binding SARP family transcriptional activator/TolB-like protein